MGSHMYGAISSLQSIVSSTKVRIQKAELHRNCGGTQLRLRQATFITKMVLRALREKTMTAFWHFYLNIQVRHPSLPFRRLFATTSKAFR
jgi:hypothetical protein